MHRRASVAGFTLVEIIVGLLVFTVGVLALAASSGVVAKAMANGATRELAARSAVSRVETIISQCATATSGRERLQEIESDWVIIRGVATIEVTETVRCLSAGLACAASYGATVWCPR
jgi:Tfp pilus assembly protein FimT